MSKKAKIPAAAKAKAADRSGQFTGFGPRALDFFKALAFHQSREWFLENKALYESDVQRPMTALVVALAAEFARLNVPLIGDAKSSMFRIHRDVHFSKNKDPYKTHAGATLTRDGGKLSPGLLYIHVAPEGSFMAAAFYRPEPKVLAALRAGIAAAPAKWLAVERHLAGERLELSREDALTRLPRGFEAAPPEVADALKLRSVMTLRPIPAEALWSGRLVDDITAFTVSALPLLEFGWRAIDTAKGEHAE